MEIKRLDHVNIVTTQLDTMVAWYTTFLGLTVGDRPDFPFPGAWLYAGDLPVVHLIAQDGSEGVGSEVPLKLEHFAFTATGAQAFAQKLADKAVPFDRSEVPAIGLVQFHVADPDGNHIHIDFPTDEGA